MLEDDPEIQLLISKVLAAHGFQIDAVSDGLQGLVKVEAARPSSTA